MLNTGLKLFTKVLSIHLLPYLLRIIQLDPDDGLMPDREVRGRTCRVLNLLHYYTSAYISLLLLSTDAEKAFYRVSCVSKTHT